MTDHGYVIPNLEQLGWAIDKDLWDDSNDAADRPMAPVTIMRCTAKAITKILVKPQGWRAPIVAQANSSRDGWSTTDAHRFANLLRVHRPQTGMLHALLDKAIEAFAPLGEACGETPTYFFEPMINTGNPDTARITMVAPLLDGGLRLEPIAINALTAAQFTDAAATVIARHHRLNERIGRAGGRIAALRIDVVVAAAIREGINAEIWRDELGNSLEGDINAQSTIAMRNGDVDQSVVLAPGHVWSHGTLTIAETLPETLVAALPGRPLDQLIAHRWLPRGLTITAADNDDGETVVRTGEVGGVRNDLFEPLAPLLEELGVEVDEAEWHIWKKGKRT